jgi:superfamily II RNA helicase
MAKAKKETAVVEETAAVIQEEVVAAEVVATEEALEVELIAPGTFISEEGNEYEFTTGAFVFKGKKYDAVEAVANAPEVLEELVKLNSFILKQK